MILKKNRLTTLWISFIAVFICFSQNVVADTYPSKPITIVVPTSPGGANDAMARIIAQGLSQKLGQSVIVENRAGANGSIASEFVARAPADGYVLMFGYIATHAINPALQKLRYDPIKSFEPISLVATSPTLLVANNNLPVKNAKELVALLKSQPGKISYASSGKGTAPHLSGELFKLTTGTDMLHVPYKGSSPAILDTIGGTTQVMFPSLFTAYPQIKGNKLIALGIAGKKRSPVLPNVPTLAEQGIPNVEVDQWYAMFAPAGTPKPIIHLLNKELIAVLNEKSNETKIEEQGATVDTSTPEELADLVKKEVARWKKVVESAKITVD
ncbi:MULTISPECIES: tripartite tricarboxylate transporter substrate binding protein [unclassified Polynucleobacter]|uniref:Bug family tripartite tricarboxylate transporter substrate binding protein n=1 Tax=unclassified Polynucleobacter TaxID=2640945 RepID=UPI002493BAA6|nr:MULTISPECIES: tripartite tricarboxylate transporter substrate binding protein [unclassified Polynucleobacter]